MPIVARSSEFTGWAWEYGYFGLTRVKESKAIGFGKRRDRMTDEGKKNVLALVGPRQDSPLDCSQDSPPPSDSGSGGGVPLGLSELSNCHTPEKPLRRRGFRGITSHGRRLIAAAAYSLRQAVSGKRVSFLTVTLPTISQSESLDISAEWSTVLRIFGQRLTRTLKARGLSGEYFGCTEVQSKRLRSSGVVGLHLHLCFEGRRPGRTWAISCSEVRSIWREVLCARFPWLKGRFSGAEENIQTVRRECSAYLSKYMTKGCGEVIEAVPAFAGCHPTSWYHCSDSLRRRLLDARIRLSGPVARAFVDWIETAPRELRFVRRVKIRTSDGGVFTPSIYGAVSPTALEDWGSLMSIYRASRSEDVLL